MTDTYYEFGTAADRWDRAQLFSDAKEYVTAARIPRPRGAATDRDTRVARDPWPGQRAASLARSVGRFSFGG